MFGLDQLIEKLQVLESAWATDALDVIRNDDIKEEEFGSSDSDGHDLIWSIRRRVKDSSVTGTRISGAEELIEALECLPANTRVMQIAFVGLQRSIIGAVDMNNMLIGCMVVTKNAKNIEHENRDANH